MRGAQSKDLFIISEKDGAISQLEGVPCPSDRDSAGRDAGEQ
jgi:hypothetical protein